jgi:tetratricopeptide (TPR) repeat protein
MLPSCVMLKILQSICILQGNEFFKQKKFKEAIDCYSRSIAFSPTAVAYANRAMAHIKLRRQDCILS